jgi:hypothetical protein
MISGTGNHYMNDVSVSKVRAMFQTTGISFMSLTRIKFFSRFGAMFIAFGIFLPAPHVSAASFSCPETIVVRGSSYALENGSVFDGPPEEITSLVPEFIGDLRRWEIDPSINPYLVCYYKGWRDALMLHAKGATSCEVTNTAIRASCSVPSK